MANLTRPATSWISSQTGDYTIVQLGRQAELTRAIQDRRAKATAENPEKERQKLAIVEAA